MAVSVDSGKTHAPERHTPRTRRNNVTAERAAAHKEKAVLLTGLLSEEMQLSDEIQQDITQNK